jgi:hypothetical protein
MRNKYQPKVSAGRPNSYGLPSLDMLSKIQFLNSEPGLKPAAPNAPLTPELRLAMVSGAAAQS